MENTVVSVDCIRRQLGTSFLLEALISYSLHMVLCAVARCLVQLYSVAETMQRLLPPENLALSWLSHSASILTHLNESVSRSSVGGYLTPPSFSTYINNFCSTSTWNTPHAKKQQHTAFIFLLKRPKYRPSTHPQYLFVRFCSSRI